MISEGTDIPRLQVCCHLSIVKTEMHFRQVLGRILRMTGDADKNGWMFLFAEPTLVEFANELHHEIPESRVVQTDGSRPRVAAEQKIGRTFDVSNSPNDDAQVRCGKEQYLTLAPEIFDSELGRYKSARLEWAGQFREQVIATFNSSF
jgi:superfamily II DNA or RNA helicase